MRIIPRQNLPVAEAEFRSGLDAYRAAVEAHKSTVGEPAPWPAYDIFRELLTEDFVVSDAPDVDPAPPGPNAVIDTQIKAIEVRELAPRFSRESTLASIVKDHLRDYYDLKPKDATKAQVVQAVSDLTNQQHPAYSQGFVRLKALDDQIKALRAQRLA